MRLVPDRRSRFRNKLQYFYSISVFIGVLSTAYLMMERQGSVRFPFDSIQSSGSFRLEAGVGDDALARLIEVENEITTLKDSDNKSRDPKRLIDNLLNSNEDSIYFNRSQPSNGN